MSEQPLSKMGGWIAEDTTGVEGGEILGRIVVDSQLLTELDKGMI